MANRKKSQTKAQETHIVAIWPYWTHIFFAAFGALVAAYGAGRIGYDIENVKPAQIDITEGVVVILFGGMILGAAITNAADLYRSNKAKTVK